MKKRRISTSFAGQALLEFSLVILVLATILMGIFDLGRAVYTQTALSNAAREGARKAAVTFTGNASNDTATIKQAVRDTGIGLGIIDSQISITYVASDGTTGVARSAADWVTIAISSYPFIPATPFISGFFGSSGRLNMASSASMTLEVK